MRESTYGGLIRDIGNLCRNTDTLNNKLILECMKYANSYGAYGTRAHAYGKGIQLVCRIEGGLISIQFPVGKEGEIVIEPKEGFDFRKDSEAGQIAGFGGAHRFLSPIYGKGLSARVECEGDKVKKIFLPPNCAQKEDFFEGLAAHLTSAEA